MLSRVLAQEHFLVLTPLLSIYLSLTPVPRNSLQGMATAEESPFIPVLALTSSVLQSSHTTHTSFPHILMHSVLPFYWGSPSYTTSSIVLPYTLFVITLSSILSIWPNQRRVLRLNHSTTPQFTPSPLLDIPNLS